MKEVRSRTKLVSLSLAVVFMIATSVTTNATSAVGSSTKGAYKNNSKIEWVAQSASVEKALVAGFNVGFAVGAVVGLVSGVAYQLATNLIGVEAMPSLDSLNYDKNDLSQFDN